MIEVSADAGTTIDEPEPPLYQSPYAFLWGHLARAAAADPFLGRPAREDLRQAMLAAIDAADQANRIDPDTRDQLRADLGGRSVP